MHFSEAKDNLMEQCRKKGCGPAFVEAYAKLVDSWVIGLFDEAASNSHLNSGLAVVAIGGYGRGHLAPHSDVDLLFLTHSVMKQDGIARVVESVLYPLWDLKLDLGHALRTPSECVGLAKSDFATLATQLDARFLAGDEAIYHEFQKRLGQWLGSKSSKRNFVKNLKESVGERHKKYKESPYLLEPNVKEGQGALRDIHAICWAARALYGVDRPDRLTESGSLSRERVEELQAARNFITDVRVMLHRLNGERNDTLTFERQEEVASLLDNGEGDRVAKVERFMQDYYTHVYQTKSSLDYFLAQVGMSMIPSTLRKMTDLPRKVEKGLSILRGRIELGSREEVRRRPLLLMRAFEIGASSGLPISQRSLEMIRTNIDLVDNEFRSDPKVAESFMKGITAVPSKTPIMTGHMAAMQNLHFLEAYIPELAGVRAHVQHDAYHVYTVDVHLVMTLLEIKKMSMEDGDPECNGFEMKVVSELEDRRLLCLAALLHDIGKGRGGDHANVGAEMIPGIGRRLGLTDEEIDTVAYLLTDHLHLIEVATRRDLTEEKLIVTVARRVGDLERLNMLYLLTVADSRATGPGVLTPWKLSLLRDLYVKVKRVLTKSDLALKETARKTEEMLIEVVKNLEGRLSPAQIDAHLEKMSAYYLSVMNAEEVVKHILWERQLKKGQMIWEVEAKEEGYCEVTIITHDRPALLSRMAGVFTLHNINIFGAQVFTRASNVALDIFQVSHPPDRVFEEEAWARVKQDANRVLSGRLALGYRLSQKHPLMGQAKTTSTKPDRVVVDNDISDFYTIIEVYTYDRLGLLYDITQVMSDLQISINIAKISTKADQVVDVFYVRDFFGQKLFDHEQIEELKKALLFTLSDID